MTQREVENDAGGRGYEYWGQSYEVSTGGGCMSSGGGVVSIGGGVMSTGDGAVSTRGAGLELVPLLVSSSCCCRLTFSSFRTLSSADSWPTESRPWM